MGKLYQSLDAPLTSFIAAQHLFFVATAPADGHVNCSPKGRDTFRILGPNRVAYLDYIGSGVETIAHLRDNGRITIMFCAFAGAPKILRLYGEGVVLEPDHPEFGALAAHFESASDPNVRAIITVEITRIADACGYGVPLYTYEGERDQMEKWAAKKGPEGLTTYQKTKNAESIDGLPGLNWVTP